MATDLAKLLKTAKKTWGDTVEKSKELGDFQNLPDGKYIAKLISASIEDSKTTPGNFGVQHIWEVLEGDNAGDTKYDWLNIFREGEFNSYLVKRLEALTDGDASDLDIEQLESILEDVVKEEQVWEFTLKTKGEYQNLRLNSKLDDYETEEAEEEEEKPAPKAKTSTKKETPAPVKETPKAKTSTKKTPEPEPEEEEEEETEPTYSKDDEVSFDDDGETRTGKVVSVDEDAEELDVKCKVGKKFTTFTIGFAEVISEDEDEEETEEEEADEEEESETEEDDDDDEEEVEIDKGSKVEFTDPKNAKKQLKGVVTQVLEDAGQIKVKVGVKMYTIDIDQVIGVE